VSDFYTPAYFSPVSQIGVQYSFTGAIKKPKQVLPGGYLSWMIPATGEWWQAVYFGKKLSFRSLGVLANDKKSWRETIDANSFDQMLPLIGRKISVAKSTAELFAAPIITTASNGRGTQLREDIEILLNSL